MCFFLYLTTYLKKNQICFEKLCMFLLRDNLLTRLETLKKFNFSKLWNLKTLRWRITFYFDCRLFAVSRCSRCRAGISASELVMRARDLVYHVACFTCASCGTPLNKGDHFGQRDGLVYCRWETGVSDHYYPSKAVSPCYQRVRWRDWQEHEALCRTESFFPLLSPSSALMMVVEC